MSTVAVVGIGDWGRNLARNYSQIPECHLKYVCDLDRMRLERLKPQLPGTAITTDLNEVLGDNEVEAVVIATTAPTHYEVARMALQAGKHVFVEKPFVLQIAHARELIRLADRAGRIIMVGHLLEYHPVVNQLRKMIEANELGEIYYIYCQRLNLGRVRGDENALWSFAPHDISVVLYLLGKQPTEVIACGQSYLQKDIEDVVFLTLNFNSQAMAHVHVSWLDPHKTRKVTIVGSKKMAVFDDIESTEKLKIYDKSAEHNTRYDTYAEYITLRFGDVTIPHLKVDEPLRLECQHFLDCIREGRQPRSDGMDGLRVVKVLDAADRSLKAGGASVAVERNL
jgi:predicted dehydrogenase